MSSLKADTEFQLEMFILWSAYCLIRFQQGKTRPAPQSMSHSSSTKPASPGPSVPLGNMQSAGLFQVPDISPQFHLLPPGFPNAML